MCESAAFVKTLNGEKRIMENVINLKVEPGKVHLVGLLGDEKTVNGEVEEIILIDHKIIIKENA
ncbi:MAG: CooT family nickel-binding protein [Peptococcaceae bacterium]|nr:CooT family nickel-binding protein [Peptococcaceae bacterium]